jgi:hypothetical protein
MIIHFIEFLHPGIMVSDNSIKEIESRDLVIEMPENAFAYRFFDVEQITLESGKKLKSEKENYSGWTYEGQELTIEDVKRELPNKKILISNMKDNNYKAVVRTKFGQFIPLSENDKVLALVK